MTSEAKTSMHKVLAVELEAWMFICLKCRVYAHLHERDYAVISIALDIL